MQIGNGVKLFAMIALGFLLIEIGITGKLGSILGAFFTPAYMVDLSGMTPASSGGTYVTPAANRLTPNLPGGTPVAKFGTGTDGRSCVVYPFNLLGQPVCGSGYHTGHFDYGDGTGIDMCFNDTCQVTQSL